MARQSFLIRCRACLHEFVQGATRPSLPALLGALGVAGLLFVLCVTLITPDLLGTEGYGYFVVSPSDEYAYLTSEVLRISRSDRRGVSIALLGSSNTREAISSAQHLQQLLLERTGLAVKVYNLATGGLNHWEAACILDCIRDRFRGVVVLEVSPRALSVGRDHLKGLAERPRLALDSSAFDEEVRLAGLELRPRVGNYFLDHYRFFIARPGATRNILTGPVQPTLHMAEHWRQPTEKEWERAVRHLGRWKDTYRDNCDANLQVHKRLIELLREKGTIEVAFLEAVCNPRAESNVLATPDDRRLHTKYRNDVARFARDNSVPYWDLRDEARLTSADFIDHNHVRSPQARRRFTVLLADRLAAVLVECGLVKGTQQ